MLGTFEKEPTVTGNRVDIRQKECQSFWCWPKTKAYFGETVQRGSGIKSSQAVLCPTKWRKLCSTHKNKVKRLSRNQEELNRQVQSA